MAQNSLKNVGAEKVGVPDVKPGDGKKGDTENKIFKEKRRLIKKEKRIVFLGGGYL